MKSQPVWAAVVMEREVRGGSSWAGRLREDTKAGPSPLSVGGAQHFLTSHHPLALVCLAVPRAPTHTCCSQGLYI